MNVLTQRIFSISFVLASAFGVAAPEASHAGWFSSPRPVVTKVAQTVRTGATQAQGSVSELTGKLNAVYARLEENRPLVDALKNGQMLQQLTEVVQYLNDSRQDYQDFADNGVVLLRQDIRDLVYTVSSIGDTLNLDSKLGDQLHKAAGLLDRMPVAFLFALAKSGVDQRLQDILTKLTQLRNDLVLVATLPPERDVYLYPEEYQDSLCPLVNDRETRVQLAVLNARIDSNIWAIDTFSSMIPEDLNVNAMVVGGGGTTVSKFPPQYIFKAIKTILGAVKLRIGNYKSIAESLCSAG